MRKVIQVMHVSLDGIVAGPNGEINWIKVDEEMFDYVGKLTDEADTAIYGRKTYEIMEKYWPTAAEKPNATKHDFEHARWVNKALKIVFSRTINTSNWFNTRIIHDHIYDEIQKLKLQQGKNLIIFGSASIVQTFTQLGLIDEYWIFVNPIILGDGIPLFDHIKSKIELKLLEVKQFNSGGVGLHYETIRN